MKSGAPWEHTLDTAVVSRGPAPFRRYLFWFFSFMVVAYLASFPLIRSNAYTRWRGSQWGPMLEYTFTPGKRSVDVLIFGDSSAFIGIDPRIVQAQLGLKVVLLPSTIGSLPIIGDIPLRRYLATHAKPRLLVFYFSPWNLDYNHATRVRFFEGEEMMLRHGTAHEIAGLVLRHPAEFLYFPFRFYNAYGWGILRSIFRHSPPAVSVETALGHMDDNDPVPALANTCKFPTRLLEDKSEASLEELAGAWSGKVPVLVYIAPIPGCRNVDAALKRSFSGLGAASPNVFPPGDFVGDPYYAHLRPDAVPVASHLLAAAVQRQLASSAMKSPVK